MFELDRCIDVIRGPVGPDVKLVGLGYGADRRDVYRSHVFMRIHLFPLDLYTIATIASKQYWPHDATSGLHCIINRPIHIVLADRLLYRGGRFEDIDSEGWYGQVGALLLSRGLLERYVEGIALFCRHFKNIGHTVLEVLHDRDGAF